MKTRQNNASLVEARSERRSAFLREGEFVQFINDNHFESGIVSWRTDQKLNDKPLDEDKVYHMKDMAGIRLVSPGFDSFKSVQKRWKEIKRLGMMTTPAVIVSAREYREGESRFPVPAEELDKLNGVYSILEGSLDFMAWVYDVAYTSKYGGEPFDFNFVFKHVNKEVVLNSLGFSI